MLARTSQRLECGFHRQHGRRFPARRSTPDGSAHQDQATEQVRAGEGAVVRHHRSEIVTDHRLERFNSDRRAEPHHIPDEVQEAIGYKVVVIAGPARLR